MTDANDRSAEVASKAPHVLEVEGHIRGVLAGRRMHLLLERTRLVDAAKRIAEIDLELVEIQRKLVEHGHDPADDPVTPVLSFHAGVGS